MDKFIIQGGKPLSGSVAISGAKNASLELLPAAILAPGVYSFSNTPDIRDIHTMARLLESMGTTVKFESGVMTLDTSTLNNPEAPYEHVKKMRASIHVLGPLVARFGYARVSLPGGCAWGPRPVDFHLRGLEALGATIELDGGYIVARAERLRGGTVDFDFPSVGATFNIMSAATLAEGRTTITNAAMEPEVIAAGELLRSMGAQIEGLGTPTIIVDGLEGLHPADAVTIPDRIEAGTLLVALAITGSSGTITNVNPGHLEAVIAALRIAGCTVEVGEDTISLTSPERLSPVGITTAVYPGFPTDMQAQWMALMACAHGTSRITDTVYRDRFTHVPELARLGCNIEVDDNVATIHGGARLTGATVMSTDLRASVAMVLAGLVAKGETHVLRVYHLDRGYEGLEHKLNALGADVRRERTEEL